MRYFFSRQGMIPVHDAKLNPGVYNPYRAGATVSDMGSAHVDMQQEVNTILDRELSLKGRGLDFSRETHLLGGMPEFDSMTVVAVINALEDRFEFTVEDDEIDGEAFATVGSLVDFVERKLKG